MEVIHKAFGPLRTVFCAILLCLSTAAMADDGVYSVEGVGVDVTAANAVQAREKAFEEAQVTGFRMLAERVLTDQELQSFTMPDVNTIIGMVQDFEVTNEQLSAVRYVGTYTIRFRPNAVQDYLENADIQFTDQARAPVLVLPFYQYGSRTLLWDQNNPFMAAWARSANVQGSLVSTVVPIGDLMDVTQIKDNQALSYDKIQLDEMVKRYEAQEAVILIGEKQQNGNLKVSVYSTENTLPTFIRTVDIVAKSGTPQPMLYDRAVKEVQAILKQDWKQRVAIENAKQSSLKARAKFENVKEWVQLKRTLENTQGINSIRVQGLKPKEAIVHIEYAGSEERLNIILRQSGVVMELPRVPSTYQTSLSGSALYELRLSPQL